jgi:UDP-N-acetyl-D-mannosaminuronic acid dehydrogenase
MSDICVVGMGYVGLPAAIMLVNGGHSVHGVDINAALLNSISSGEIGDEEPGLVQNLGDALSSGRLKVSESPSVADAFVIAVPTPVNGDHSPDLTSVIEASRSIMGHLAEGNLVVVESTIPPGATVNTVAPILEESGLKAGVDFFLAYCPERVLPGNVMKEIVENDRIIGGIDSESTSRAVELYQSFVTGTLHESNATTAEMVKLAENTYRDVNIALANTLANISETVGVSVWDVVEMANKHPRVDLLKPGPGVGGHCIPVDPWFLVSADAQSSDLIRTARGINDGQPGVIARRALELAGDAAPPRVAILGASYKPGVSDARDSPTTQLANIFSDAGALVTVHDPLVKSFTPQLKDNIRDAVKGTDVIVVMVGHSEYQSFDPQTIAQKVRSRAVIDTCNALDRDLWAQAGFDFHRYAEPG